MPGEKRELKEEKRFYVYEVDTELGLMVYVYDKEVIEENLIEGLKYNRECSSSDIEALAAAALSLTFYGEKAVELGISLGYIHPEAVTELNGVKVAMFMRLG